LVKSLVECEIDSPGNASLILLGHLLNQSKSWVLAHGECPLTPEEINLLQMWLEQLLQGVPLPYILGEWAFYGRMFFVTPDVLIPRPETELLVERAIAIAQDMENPRVVDVGTGSGAVAVTLAAELPGAKAIALDLSWPALKVAQRNAQRHAQTRIHFIQSNLLRPFAAPFDLVCANLPYVPTETLKKLAVAKWEPRLALDGGKTGLDAIRTLLQQAQTRLAPKGVILLEIESTLGEATLSAARTAFPSAKVDLLHDLAGKDRLIEIRRD